MRTCEFVQNFDDHGIAVIKHLQLNEKVKLHQMPLPWSCWIGYVGPSHISLEPPCPTWQAEASPPLPDLCDFLFTLKAVRAGQVAKTVTHGTAATRQYHRHQLPHSRGAAWQPHGNRMVQSLYTTTGTRVCQGGEPGCICSSFKKRDKTMLLFRFDMSSAYFNNTLPIVQFIFSTDQNPK